MDRRLRQNGVVLFFSLIIFLSVWQIITNPGPPLFFQIESYTVPTYNLINPNDTYIHPMSTLNESDYTQLMNLTNFSFTIMNTPCNETYPFIIILVHTAPWNFAKRKTIRETWGNRVDSIRLLFMLGQVNTPDVQRKLDLENDTYGDFVQGTFFDSYRNVTYKHAMVFKYVIYHCPHAKYVVKTDDDVFVNVYTLVDYLKNELSLHGANNLLLCNVQGHAKAMRSYRSKWRVSFKEYQEKYYPPYCPGWTLVYSSDVVFMLYRELQNRSYFWIDDVLITGIIAKSLSLAHTNSHHLKMSKDDLHDIVYKNQTSAVKHFLFGTGELSEQEIRTLWNYTVRYVKDRSIGANQKRVTTNS